MILTNKTLEHFLDWKVNNKNLSTIEVLDFKHLSVTSQNALIIEFFNEQEYKVEADVYNLWNYCFVKCYWDRGFKEYKKSVVQAIKKANDLYNNTDKV